MKKKKLLITLVCLFFTLVVIAPPVSETESLEQKYQEFLKVEEEKRVLLELQRYLLDIGFSESNNNPKAINLLGYCGEYQFGFEARKDVGFGHITLEEFRQNPEIWPKVDQDTAMVRYLKFNEEKLKKELLLIEQDSIFIKGILLTKSGLLAAAHLTGAGGVKKFIETKGKLDFEDCLGTSISDYLSKFSNYKF